MPSTPSPDSADEVPYCLKHGLPVDERGMCKAKGCGAYNTYVAPVGYTDGARIFVSTRHVDGDPSECMQVQLWLKAMENDDV